MAYKRKLGKQQELFKFQSMMIFCFAVGEQNSSEAYFISINSI